MLKNNSGPARVEVSLQKKSVVEEEDVFRRVQIRNSFSQTRTLRKTAATRWKNRQKDKGKEIILLIKKMIKDKRSYGSKENGNGRKRDTFRSREIEK